MDGSSPALFYCLLFEHTLWKVLNLCGRGENIVLNPHVLWTKLLILRTGFSARSGSQTGRPCSSVPGECGGRQRRPVLEAGGVCGACCASYPQTVTALSFGLSLRRLLFLSFLSIFNYSCGEFQMLLTLHFFPLHWLSSSFPPQLLPEVQSLHFGRYSTAQSWALWLCFLHS